MSIEYVDVQNTTTGKIGRVARSVFESPVFNPNGLLERVYDVSGCDGCGVEPSTDPIPESEYDLLPLIEDPDNEKDD